MVQKIFTPKVLIIGGIIVFAALMRLAPIYPNFTPIGAMALFAGAHIANRKLAIGIPLLAMFLSDIFLGFHQMMLPVYLGFVLMVLIGTLLRNRIQVATVAGGAIAGSVVFFVITNFAVWLSGTLYPMTLPGLVQCYVAAIPFFHTSLLGDLLYSSLFFGSFYAIGKYYPALQQA